MDTAHDGRDAQPLGQPALHLVLDEAECLRLRLLDTAPIGRIAFTEGALPAVQPVTFARRDRGIYVPTHPDSAVAAASRGAVAAFEVDQVDVGARTGWNVTAVKAVPADHRPARGPPSRSPRDQPVGPCGTALLRQRAGAARARPADRAPPGSAGGRPAQPGGRAGSAPSAVRSWSLSLASGPLGSTARRMTAAAAAGSSREPAPATVRTALTRSCPRICFSR